MAEQMYSAEEAARLLGLQVRTVRNYVRDGVLPGVRLGKQYRIARADLEAFTAGAARPVEGQGSPAAPASVAGAGRGRAEASCVVHLDGLTPVAIDRLERTLEASCPATPGPEDELLRVQRFHDPGRNRLKVVIVGPLDETADLLRIIDAFATGAG